MANRSELYIKVAIEELTFKQIREFFRNEKSGRWYKYIQRKLRLNEIAAQAMSPIDKIIQKVSTKPTELIIDDKIDQITYTISDCCNPIPGDNVFGFLTENEGIKIHRTNCPEALQLMSRYGSKIVKAKYNNLQKISFLTGIKISGVDDVGLLNRINMRSLNFVGHDGTFEGTVMVYVQDTNQLKELMANLKKIKGIVNIARIDRTE